MRRERSLQNIIIIVLSIAVIAMSIGFATYSTTLNINGTAKFTPAKWDIHFVSNSFTENANNTGVSNTTHTVTDDTVTYAVTLDEPGSTYSFDVQVKNFGTIKGKLVKVEMPTLTTDQAKYIEHTVKYGANTYTSTTDGLAIKIDPNETETITVTVTVKYNYPEEASDLPTTEQTFNANVKLYYKDFNAA